MTKAGEALKKLKSHCNIAYYLNKSDMQAITDACNNYSDEPVVEAEEKVSRTAKTEKATK